MSPRSTNMDACTDTNSARTGGSANKSVAPRSRVQFTLCMKCRIYRITCRTSNYTHSQLKWFEHILQGSHSRPCWLWLFFKGRQTSPLWCPMQLCFFFFMQTVQGCKLCFRTSLHSLVKVTSFIGAKRVEGGHNKLPIKGAARQQPLSLFGVARVGVLYKHLLDTQRTHG